MAPQRNNLLGLTRAELEEFMASLGEPRYRGAQLFRWIYLRGAGSFDAMTDLSLGLRSALAERAELRSLTTVTRQTSAADGTTKFLFALDDGLRIESVLIPPSTAFRGEGAGSEDEQRRLTLCVSTQVGCPLDCAFCATATMGFSRNLTAAEIAGQFLQARRESGRPVTNVVFMGMGEPLMNYENVMKAAEVLSTGLGVAAQRITVSTAGWADRIRQMGDERRRVKLAVSLHSAVEETRRTLMPVTKRYPLPALLDAVEHYHRRTRRRVTYEVVFFDGVNDSDAELRALVRAARRVPCKINVIPYHSIHSAGPMGLGAGLRPSPRADELVERLRREHLTVFVRSSAGEDIDAACGQLAVKDSRLAPPSRRTRPAPASA
jgi:23S rRNA (adenine2503-C2)-methyltransferase